MARKKKDEGQTEGKSGFYMERDAEFLRKEEKIGAYLRKLHENAISIKINDDNNIMIDKICWEFYAGDHFQKPVYDGNTIVFETIPDEELEGYQSKVNKIPNSCKRFAAKMVADDAEAAVIAYPENRDYLDESMALFLNTLSRVIWRTKEVNFASYSSAKDGCITGKCHLMIDDYKDDNGEGDFDINYVVSLEVFSDHSAKKLKDRKFVYRRYGVTLESIKNDYKKYGYKSMEDIEKDFKDLGHDDQYDIYDQGSGLITMWDFYSFPIDGVDEKFHVRMIGKTPHKMLWYRTFDREMFPIMSAGMNIVGSDILHGRGFVRDVLGLQMSANNAASIMKSYLANYEVFGMFDRDAKVTVENVDGEGSKYKGLFYDGSDGKPPQNYTPADLPALIRDAPMMYFDQMDDITGIRDFSQIPERGSRAAVGTMQLLVSSEKQVFTEEMMQFTNMISHTMKYAFLMVQEHYSEEKIKDMVGNEHAEAIRRFKKDFDVYKNYDFTITIGTGFTDNLSMQTQELAMLVKIGVVSPKEARMYLQRQGKLRKTPFGNTQSEGKARLLLERIKKAKTPNDFLTKIVNKAQFLNIVISKFDDLEVFVNIFTDYVSSSEYVNMIETDPVGLSKAETINLIIEECQNKMMDKEVTKVLLQQKMQQAISALMPVGPQAPGGKQMPSAPENGPPNPAVPVEGQQFGNPDQMQMQPQMPV